MSTLSGSIIGRWRVFERVAEPRKETKYRCICVCGTERLIRASRLSSFDSLSCGCMAKDLLSEATKTHGMSKSAEFRAWANMWDRCTRPTHKQYPQYKARTPPLRWRSFEMFLSDVGLRPSKLHSLDRIDNSKPYGPDNTRWATSTQQQNNTSRTVRLTHAGRTQGIAQWARELGVSKSTLCTRLYRGWTVNEILARPIRAKHKEQQLCP